jgi:hypothetical protein
MTHAVHRHYARAPAGDTDEVGLASKKRLPTEDRKALSNFPLSDGGYEWGNIQWLKDGKHNGWHDSGRKDLSEGRQQPHLIFNSELTRTRKVQ